MKKLLCLILMLFSMSAMAKNYVIWHYAVEKSTDQKEIFNCKEITDHPVRYTIKNDKVYYAKDNYFSIQNYKRISTVKASKDIVLYSGVAQLTPHDKKNLKQYPLNIQFVLLKDLEIIRGSWQVANCKGLFIGAREK